MISLYVVVLVGGLACLLRELGRPAWLLLAAPPLVYNDPATKVFSVSHSS